MVLWVRHRARSFRRRQKLGIMLSYCGMSASGRSWRSKNWVSVLGKKREYISSLEQGKIDMQLSTFMLIAKALGLKFSLVVG